MLQWFVTEQVEEEKTVRTLLEQVEQIGESSTAMYFLDRHLGKEAEEGESLGLRAPCLIRTETSRETASRRDAQWM
jgi:hypothetical protein